MYWLTIPVAIQCQFEIITGSSSVLLAQFLLGSLVSLWPITNAVSVVHNFIAILQQNFSTHNSDCSCDRNFHVSPLTCAVAEKTSKFFIRNFSCTRISFYPVSTIAKSKNLLTALTSAITCRYVQFNTQNIQMCHYSKARKYRPCQYQNYFGCIDYGELITQTTVFSVHVITCFENHSCQELPWIFFCSSESFSGWRERSWLSFRPIVSALTLHGT